MKKKLALYSTLLLLALALSSCNLPRPTEQVSGPDQLNTLAAQTVVALSTTVASAKTQSPATPAPTGQVATATPPGAATETPAGSATVATPCDRV